MFGRTAFDKAQLGASLINDKMSIAIDRWLSLYKGQAPWLVRNSHGLGLPTAIAREIATLVTLELEVAVNDPSQAFVGNMQSSISRAKFIQGCFDDVLKNIAVQTEYACALGGLVFKPYVDGQNVYVDYVHADDFYPISFDSKGEIRSAIFLAHIRKGDKYYTRCEKHDWMAEGYIITNRAFKSYNQDDIGTEISLSEVEEWVNIEPEIMIQNIDSPLFAYFKIPQGNVIDKDSQLGVSVYARADQAGLLEEADKQWQRYMWEYEAGEMAVDASEDAFRQVKLRDGSLVPVLPTGKERLFRINSISPSTGSSIDDLMRVFSPTLRDANYSEGLNNVLMRVEDACGLARGTFSDAQETARTATELRISRQRSYATVTAIQMSLQSALNDLAKAIDTLATLYNLAPIGEYSIAYKWDDSIVVDADTEREKDRTDVRDGLMMPWEYRVKWYGETETEARAILAQAEGPSDDEIMGFRQRLEREPDANAMTLEV